MQGLRGWCLVAWRALCVTSVAVVLLATAWTAAFGQADAGATSTAASNFPVDQEQELVIAKRLEAFRQAAAKTTVLRVIPIEGTVEKGLAAFVERSLDALDGATAVVFRIDTFGGRVDAAVQIRDAILATDAPTIAYVQRAISAGALIALAADVIVMGPGASMGAATPVTQGADGEMAPTSEKVVSYMRAEMRSTAEANGRPGVVAEAMVDEDIAIAGLIDKGKLLTLTGQRAVQAGGADLVAASLEAARADLALEQATPQAFEVNWAERLARFFTDPVVSSLLMSLGFIGLLLELYSPGFGLGGVLGITCLMLFFAGHYLARLAGWEELLLLGVGLGLLALEVLVIPGFGVAGISGLLLVVVSLGMVLVRVDLPFPVARELGYVQEALSRAVIQLAVVFTTVGITGAVLAHRLPRSRFASWLVFKPASEPGQGGLGAEAPGGSLPSHPNLLHQRGVTQSVLRPAGIAEFGGQRVHVVSDGEFIDPDEPVEVVAVEGHRIVVRKVMRTE